MAGSTYARFVFLIAAGGIGCAKLMDRTTLTPTNKAALVPYVTPPALELAPPNGKLSNGAIATTFCHAGADGGFDFTPQMSAGADQGEGTGKYFFGEGGGCINRDLLDVWATSMNQELMVWDDKGNSGTYVQGKSPKGVARFFDVEYTHVEDDAAGMKVKWNMTWYHTVLLGLPWRPDRVLINYRRYKGTKFIKYWEGSIILTRIAPDVTAVWIRNQIRAAQVTEKQARGGATDILRKLREGAPARHLLP